MWVQEGNDCKENESNTSSSLWTRLYARKSRQSVTTVAIPMNMPASKRFELEQKYNVQNNQTVPKNQKHKNGTIAPVTPRRTRTEQKEQSLSPRSPKLKVIPVSPAQFLESIQKNNIQKANGDDDFEMHEFNKIIDEEEEEEDEDDDDDDENNSWGMNVDDIFDQSADNHNLQDDDLQDLQIIGKKILNFSAMDTEKDDEDNELISSDAYVDESNQDIYVPKIEFSGLDIKLDREWIECINYTNDDNLLIIELYSTMFGPSNVMFPFIDEIIHKNGKNKIKFVRINLSKFKQIAEVQDIISSISNYHSTPIPIYLFIKNGVKVDELNGSKIKEFEHKTCKHSISIQIQKTSEPIKYRSILSEKPINNNCYNKENNQTESNIKHVENIKNLIKNLQINDNKYRLSPTKLSKYQNS